jgi:hypothetical protein
MVSDEHYATVTLLRAIFSKDASLVELAKDLTVELDLNVHLIRAAEHYTATLEQKAILSTNAIQHSKRQLLTLVTMLGSKDGHSAYRSAVNAFIAQADEDEKFACATLARDFYPFWVQEVRPEISFGQPFDNTRPFLNKDPHKGAFIQAWNSIDNHAFNLTEQQVIETYVNALGRLVLKSDAITVRAKLAKLILQQVATVRLGDGQAYRSAVDQLYQQIHRPDFKSYFLEVAREFYYFWRQDAQPEKHLFDNV